MRVFPLIADGEPVISSPRQMFLYENQDLITNIRGDYQDKPYHDVLNDFQPVTAETRTQVPQERLNSVEAGRSYAEQARQTAKADLRKKRQSLVTGERITATRPLETPAVLATSDQKELSSRSSSAYLPKEVSRSAESEERALAKYSEKLRQSTYILADIKPIYQEPKVEEQPIPKKNSYEFLKRSQVYNYEDNQLKKERQVAQELNLTRFTDLD